MEDNNEIKRKAEELAKKIKTSEEELIELRKMCKHSEYEIKNINSEAGSPALRRVCKQCQKELGFPSTQDLENNGYK